MQPGGGGPSGGSIAVQQGNPSTANAANNYGGSGSLDEIDFDLNNDLSANGYIK